MIVSWQNWCFSWLSRKTTKSLTRKPALSAHDMRAHSAKWSSRGVKPPRGWRVREMAARPLCGEWIEPADPVRRDSLRRIVIYLHGGGYCFCSPRTHRTIAGALAKGADARTFSLDYRLAPEHPFPAAVEDALASYRQLLADGASSDRIVIGGDSSGGGLALALLLSLRDAGDPLPAGAVLFSPWTDLAATGASLKANDEADVMLSAAAVANFSQYYLGGTAADHPIASPLYGEYSGLPPLFVQASDTEVLLDDAARVAEKARVANVAVDFKVWHRVPHAWPTLTPYLPEAKAAVKEATDFIRRVVP
ncbi:alpha/beta hydrolase [Burkholderia sp. MSMB2042]|nr:MULTISPECIES: alpha/beta hydrolase [Burkholderia]AOJ71592.1 alpha/beta hydrolase [Burkholderia savannae]KVG41995.1 alpha/beta hydrolase [Burkholderia sp. MSMB0265]KVG93571.1 alpha/beta hydrolase [Burkholderia sp. MSMB2042]KVG97008.1 alpha/beta hydrolase [Burkholderia sp. MSMB2041]